MVVQDRTVDKVQVEPVVVEPVVAVVRAVVRSVVRVAVRAVVRSGCGGSDSSMPDRKETRP